MQERESQLPLTRGASSASARAKKPILICNLLLPILWGDSRGNSAGFDMKMNDARAQWFRGPLQWMTFGILFCATTPAWGQAGALDTSYQPNPSYVVSAVAIQADGKALIGGGFGTVDGLARRFVARLNTNGTVDTGFVPANIEDGEVLALASQPDGKILVGGRFWHVGGIASPSVARLEANGALDATFNSALTVFLWIHTLALQNDGKVLVASDEGLDRLMPDGGLDTSFQRLAASQWITNDGSMTTANNSFSSIAQLGDGNIILGGDIQAIAGQAVGAGVIRLNTNGTWDPSFHSFTNWSVSALLVQPDGQIVIGRNGRLARLNADGTMDGTFASQTIESDVMALARQSDGKILVGGYFQRTAGLLRPGIARFGLDGTLDRHFDAGDVGEVSSVAVQGDAKILIGGYFTSVNRQTRPYVARLLNDDTNSPGRFEFLSTSNSVAEAAGSLVIPVCRYAGSAGTASVVVATDWGSALPGADYLSRTQTLVFLPGQTSNYFTVPILDDALVEGPYGWEAFTVQLSGPTGGATLGSESRATAYILEDDTAIGFESAGVQADEATGQAVIHAVRLGVTSSTVSAFFQTEDGTAFAPGDYTAQSGTVAFAPGETNQTIIVPLNDDTLVEGDETFSVRLSAPTGGASLATSNLTVHITDDVSFMAFDSDLTVTETDAQAVLTAHRWGRTNNTVSVHYATGNLSALAGTDYVATSGTLTLLPGELAGTITVPILDDSAVEDLKQFQVTLSEPAGTLVLPYGMTSTVSVISDDGAGYPDTRFKPVVPGGRVNQIALVPGDKVLARGDRVLTNGTLRPTLVRYNLDGSVDTAFQPILIDDVFAMAVDASGRVYVGTGFGVGTSVRRLQANGAGDGRFDPFFVDCTAPGNAPIRAMVVQADGKLIVSAFPAPYYFYEATTNYLNRLNEDGSYDLAFGPVSGIGDEMLAMPPSALALQPDGKLVLAATLLATNGVSRNRVIRLTEDGHHDATFGAPLEVTGNVQGIHPLANGKILINGSFTAINGTPRLGMAILAADGSLDPAFVPPFQAYDYFNNNVMAAAVQGDGKVVFCGDVRLAGGLELSLGRLNSSGSLDSSFRSASSFSTYLWDLALQSDGKVLLGGSSGPFFGAGFERLNNDPQAAAGFVEFSAASALVSETNTSVTVSVRRGGGTNGLVRVRYATVDGTATASSDFVAQTGIVEFTAGDTTEKLITISLLDDMLAEGDESFGISLGSPVGGATWGENSASTIVVREDDMALPPFARLVRASNGQCRIQFLGTTGAKYSVLASSDLIHWEIIGAAAETSPGVFEFSDPASVYQSSHFYRLRWP